MLELIDPHPTALVQEGEYRRLLGYPPDRTLDGRARELAEEATRWYAEQGRPWIYARQTGHLELAGGTVRVDGAEFPAPRLYEQFHTAHAHDVVVAAVSAGAQCEERARRLWQEGKPDEYFFLETLGSAVVEHLITATGARLCEWAEERGMAVLPHYSPGYSGWDISDQHPLLALLRAKGQSQLPGELSALESGMLRPKKSLLALFGLTRFRDAVASRTHLSPCENCSFSPCQYRRAPYRHSPPALDDLQSLRGRPIEDRAAVAAPSPLTGEAAYTVHLRALRKWSQERLELRIHPDRSVEAHFRYDGTTCTNLGRPLQYDYHVRLGSPEDLYVIREARCTPAPDDTGHTSMCVYLSNADLLQRSMEAEQPLLGQPLDEFLSWRRPHRPSGCYCLPESRLHKWGQVLEVIHFALVQHERELAPRRPTSFVENSAPRI